LIYLKRASGNLGRSIHRCFLMCYHSKGYQQGLQGWPTDVFLSTTCISYVYDSLNHGFMHVTIDLCGLKTLEYVSTLKKKLTHTFCRGKCSDTTCNIPYIKCMKNRNKMLVMEAYQQYNQNIHHNNTEMI
jgi:hypothetical protein